MMTGTLGLAALTFGSISSPLMPGILMSERIRISKGSADRFGALQRLRRRVRKFHHETAGADVAAELLAKFDVGFVIDRKDIGAQFLCPCLLRHDTRQRNDEFCK